LRSGGETGCNEGKNEIKEWPDEQSIPSGRGDINLVSSVEWHRIAKAFI